MPKSRKKRKTVAAFVPPYTASLDAKIPSENIVLSHFLPELKKWYVASQASDGRIFTALGNTEPTSRRAAGMLTFEHLKSKALGDFKSLSEEEIEAARGELIDALSEIEKIVLMFNEPFPETYTKDVILIELRAARALVLERAERSVLARWIAPPLLFLAGAFAESIIGYGADKGIEALIKLLTA